MRKNPCDGAGVPIDLEYFESHGPLATVLSIDKAKKFMGWEPEEDWRLKHHAHPATQALFP